MSEVIVTVRGEHEVRVRPERAIVRVSVRAEGPERGPVVDEALRLSEPVREDLAERTKTGSALDWSSANLSVRAERPWSSDGSRLAPVYMAGVDFTATFAEDGELSLWVTEVSAREGVEVGWVDWHLTPRPAPVSNARSRPAPWRPPCCAPRRTRVPSASIRSRPSNWPTSG